MSENSTIQFPDGKYTGSIQNGKREGFGKLEQSWGGIYEGNFKNDKKDGKGSLIVPGSRYEGSWKEDKRSGYGVKVWTNGRRYEGEWVNDEIEGQGRWRWGDGRFFLGKFKSDCPVQGTLLDVDGHVYRVTYNGKTDIADTALRPATKVIADPADSQAVKDTVAIWERRLSAASRIEGLHKQISELEASAVSDAQAHEDQGLQLEAATAEAAETARSRDAAASASAEAEQLAKEAEKVWMHPPAFDSLSRPYPQPPLQIHCPELLLRCFPRARAERHANSSFVMAPRDVLSSLTPLASTP